MTEEKLVRLFFFPWVVYPHEKTWNDLTQFGGRGSENTARPPRTQTFPCCKDPSRLLSLMMITFPEGCDEDMESYAMEIALQKGQIYIVTTTEDEKTA